MSPDPIKTATEPIPSVPVTLIGTQADVVPTTGTVAVTPGPQQPNLVVRVITPLVALFVRFGNEWCVSFSGSMLAGGITSRVLPHTDMVTMLIAASILATSIAGVGLVKNAGTIFGKLEQKYPLATGSV